LVWRVSHWIPDGQPLALAEAVLAHLDDTQPSPDPYGVSSAAPSRRTCTLSSRWPRWSRVWDLSPWGC